MPNMRKATNLRRRRRSQGVSLISCASTGSSSVTKYRRAAKPADRIASIIPDETRASVVLPSSAPAITGEHALSTIPRLPHPPNRRSSNSSAIATPSERNSVERATVNRRPCFWPTPRPTPTRMPSIRTSIPTAATREGGSFRAVINALERSSVEAQQQHDCDTESESDDYLDGTLVVPYVRSNATDTTENDSGCELLNRTSDLCRRRSQE